MNSKADSQHYLDNKARFDNMLTVYGRKPVLEVLSDHSIPVYRLHIADSNKPGSALKQLIAAAEQRDIDIHYVDKKALSRISRNSKQDQGVAADLALPHYQQCSQFVAQYQPSANDRFMAVDQVTNPQNLGMIIRSAAAAGITGLIIPSQGSASIGPLVIKASAGTVFKCPILRCEQLTDAVSSLRDCGVKLATLAADGDTSLFALDFERDSNGDKGPWLFIMGNESNGVSPAIEASADRRVYIPMQNGVESLNVAVTAGLVAFISGRKSPSTHTMS